MNDDASKSLFDGETEQANTRSRFLSNQSSGPVLLRRPHMARSDLRLQVLARQNRHYQRLARSYGETLEQLQVERQNLLTRLEAAIERAERADMQAYGLAEMLEASKKYVVTAGTQRDVAAAHATQQAEELRLRLLTIESRFSYRLLRLTQKIITRAIPPHTNRAEAWRGMRKKMRVLRHVRSLLMPSSRKRVVPDPDYQQWLADHRATPAELRQQQTATFAYTPLISFIVPVYNPPLQVLRDTIQAVLNQTYDRWELCLVNADPRNKRISRLLNGYARRDSRVRVHAVPHNLGISGNSNVALEMATGTFIALLDHDDSMEPDTLYHVVHALNEDPEADLVYFDQDIVSADGQYYERPLFKPGWSPDLLVTAPYPTHAVIRRKLIAEVGGFDSSLDGTQDWDLFLRLTEHGCKAIHIPKVLYHWRMIPTSAAGPEDAKPYVWSRQLEAVERHMHRRGLKDAKATFAAPGAIKVRWQPTGCMVSIIISTRDNVERLRQCVLSVRTLTTYRHYEIVLVDMGSHSEETARFYAACERDPHVRIVRCGDGTSRWRANNIGARHAQGELLLFLGDHVEALDSDWLDELARWAELPEIGVVGAQVRDAEGRIQDAGLVAGLGTHVGHVFAGSSVSDWGPYGPVTWYRNYTAVSGACQIMKRHVFECADGYDETYESAFADVDLCLRIARNGLRTMYTPWARLVTQANEPLWQAVPTNEDCHKIRDRLGDILQHGDPYFNANLSHTNPIPSLP